MAKKKSKRFIIPSFHFLTTNPVQKTEVKAKDIPVVKKSTSINQPPEPSVSAAEKPTQTKQNRDKELIKPKPPELKQTGRRNSALSLSSLKRNKEEEAILKKKREQREEIKDLPKDPFTQARFLEVWDAYVEDLHEKGEKILASILNADAPKLKGHLIHVSYPNELMKVELLKVRPRVLRFLREKLNNFDIDFAITVSEDHTKRFAYTPQEKYELLKEKNEAIALLRKKFNLEL
jgi:DNA polymerase-3 subunit gamma/tau